MLQWFLVGGIKLAWAWAWAWLRVQATLHSRLIDLFCLRDRECENSVALTSCPDYPFMLPHPPWVLTLTLSLFNQPKKHPPPVAVLLQLTAWCFIDVCIHTYTYIGPGQRSHSKVVIVCDSTAVSGWTNKNSVSVSVSNMYWNAKCHLWWFIVLYDV